MSTATPSASSSLNLNPNVYEDPYRLLVHYVTEAATALQTDSAALDALAALPTLTEADQAQRNAIWARMDSIEATLLSHLNRESAAN